MNRRGLAAGGVVAILAASFVGTVTLAIMGGPADPILLVLAVLVPAMMVATAHFLLLGLPAAFVVALHGRIGWWNSALAGTLIGGAPLPTWILLSAPDLDGLALKGVVPVFFTLGLAGLAGGLAFRAAYGNDDGRAG